MAFCTSLRRATRRAMASPRGSGCVAHVGAYVRGRALAARPVMPGITGSGGLASKGVSARSSWTWRGEPLPRASPTGTRVTSWFPWRPACSGSFVRSGGSPRNAPPAARTPSVGRSPSSIGGRPFAIMLVCAPRHVIATMIPVVKGDRPCSCLRCVAPSLQPLVHVIRHVGPCALRLRAGPVCQASAT